MLKPYSWTPRLLQTLAWIPTRLILNTCGHFKVKGTENLKGIPQALFAVNHASEIDPIVLTAALSPIGRFSPMFYVTAPVSNFKSDEFGLRRFIYTGFFFKAWGAYPIQRGLHNYADTLKDYVDILDTGGSVCIFPEGGITKDGNLREAHGGVAFLSHTCKVPIVPVAITGTYGLSTASLLMGKNHITLNFGKPETVSFPNLSTIEPMHYKSAAQIVMAHIKALIQKENGPALAGPYAQKIVTPGHEEPFLKPVTTPTRD